MSVVTDPDLQRLLTDLHAKSDAQAADMQYFLNGVRYRLPTDEEFKLFRSDKLLALDRDKAEFCYQLCRAIDARRIVEIGTSYGVSTLYLAAAVRDNVELSGGSGVVIGTEYEPAKVAAARLLFERTGLSRFIDLREGDLRETLRQIDAPVDFMLIDAWIGTAQPALELVAPWLRQGAIVVCDDSFKYRNGYAGYLAFLADPANGFRTMTLPFQGGLEFSVRCDAKTSR
jgi:predicted O-methyltransferase YrrM